MMMMTLVTLIDSDVYMKNILIGVDFVNKLIKGSTNKQKIIWVGIDKYQYTSKAENHIIKINKIILW